MSTLRERVIVAGRAAWETYNDGSTNVYDQEDAVAIAGARAALEQAQKQYAVVAPYRDMNGVVADLLADLSPSPAVELTAPPVTGWQSIETAPRDSRRILVYCPGDGRTVFEAWWRMPYEAAPAAQCSWCYDGDKTMLSADVHTDLSGAPLGATYWMPLPDPPAVEPTVKDRA